MQGAQTIERLVTLLAERFFQPARTYSRLTVSQPQHGQQDPKRSEGDATPFERYLCGELESCSPTTLWALRRPARGLAERGASDMDVTLAAPPPQYG